MTARFVVVSDASKADSGAVRRTAESLLTSSVRPAQWLVLGSSIEGFLAGGPPAPTTVPADPAVDQ